MKLTNWFKTTEQNRIANLSRSQQFRYSVSGADKIRFTDRRPRLSYASSFSAWDNARNEAVPNAKLGIATL